MFMAKTHSPKIEIFGILVVVSVCSFFQGCSTSPKQEPFAPRTPSIGETLNVLAEDPEAFEEVLLRLPGGKSLGAQSVAAFFPGDSIRTVPLTIEVEGNGQVTVTLIHSTGNIKETLLTCMGGRCSGNVPHGRGLSLRAIGKEADTFLGWVGECPKTNTCSLESYQNQKNIKAVFEGDTNPVSTLNLLVSGNGTIFDSAGSFRCMSGTCVVNLHGRSTVFLQPTDATNFKSWGGGCGDIPKDKKCSVKFSSSNIKQRIFKSLEGNFPQRLKKVKPDISEYFTLTVEVTAGGTIVSNPAGLICNGGVCSANFSKGQDVKLISSGSQLNNWVGCDGEVSDRTLPCSIRMIKSKIVSASFNLPRGAAAVEALSVEIRGNGRVISEGGNGLSCAKGKCQSTFIINEKVTLTSIEGDLESWEGDCKGSGKCEVTLDRPKHIVAIFSEKAPPEKPDLLALSSEERRRLLHGLPEKEREALRVAFREYEEDRFNFCKDRYPRIHAIGTSNELVFQLSQLQTSSQKKLPPGKVTIPIEGRDIHPRCVKMNVAIVGTHATRDESAINVKDFIDVKLPTNKDPDRGSITLGSAFLNQIQSGERLEVHISLSQKEQIKGQKDRFVSYFSRRFSLYENTEFNEKQKATLVPVRDFEAFPLPDDEVDFLFGPVVRRNFFVVRLSVRNDSDISKLISTGMISAHGRAIVQPKKPTAPKFYSFFGGVPVISDTPRFTVPVSLAPQSGTQMYTILADEEVEQPRAKFFSGLKFVGALASATAAAFGGIDINKGVGIFTGIFIPEAEKALPDRWPGFKRNIVDFAMPDLVKVPPHGVSDHKYLFFSKKKIGALISDHNMYAVIDAYDQIEINQPSFFRLVDRVVFYQTGFIDGRFTFLSASDFTVPDTRVISLEFDSLEIPFEQVFDDEEQLIKELYFKLLTKLPKQIQTLEDIQTSDKSQLSFSGELLRKEVWEKVDGLVTDVNGKLEENTDQNLVGIVNFGSLFERVNELGAALFPEAGNPSYEVDLLSHGDHSLKALKVDQQTLDLISKKMLSRSDSVKLSESEIRRIDKAYRTSEQVFTFYKKVLGHIRKARGKLERFKVKIGSAADDKKGEIFKDFNYELLNIVKEFEQLSSDRQALKKENAGNLSLIESVQWAQVKTLADKVIEYELSVEIDGVGTVSSVPEGITCNRTNDGLSEPEKCKKKFSRTQEVKLTAGAGLTAWSGACSGNESPCKVVLSQNRSVAAKFGQN